MSKEPCLLTNFDPEIPIKLYQGKLTPYWFPILVAILKENDMFELVMPNLSIQNTFNKDRSVIIPASMTYCGTFQFCFRRGSVLENVIIDDLLPTTVNCHLLSAISSNSDEFFPALIEKAYAKFLGGYYNVENESFIGALMDFTGGLPETLYKGIDEKLTETEIETYYRKIVNMIGDSFVICQVDRHSELNGHSEDSPPTEYQIYKVTGHTQLPLEPPDGILSDLVNTITISRGEFIPVMRISPLTNADETSGLDKYILHEWQNCTILVKKKYGVEFNSNKENWISLENLINASERVVIFHMFYRNPIVALAKKQPYWKYTFFESFWHRDIQKGNIDTIGKEFLKNNQYLVSVDEDEGATIKIMLTNIQKYTDIGPNTIQLGNNTEIGLTVFEVEKNRIYRVHDLEHTYERTCQVDFETGRYLVLSADLERGHYVVIPWISAGAGIKYTLQTFSSSGEVEITNLDVDIPKPVSCNTCQIKKAAFQTPNKIKSLYSRVPNDSNSTSSRKSTPATTDLCQECRSLYPKRATRISVIGAKNIILTAGYQLPNFFFKIFCEDETYTSKTISSTLSPQWNEHYLFYRVSDCNSQASIQLFCETKLGFKSTVFINSFTETELRDKCKVSLSIGDAADPANESDGNKLNIEIQNYFLSEFNTA